MHGYPTTLGLAITLIMLTVVAPLMKVRTLMRRWSSQHVAVMIEPEDYGGVVGEVKQALAAGGWQTERRQASAMLRWPIKAVTALAGGSMNNLVADELTTLVSPKLEVRIYPSDLELRGQEDDVVHAGRGPAGAN